MFWGFCLIKKNPLCCNPFLFAKIVFFWCHLRHKDFFFFFFVGGGVASFLIFVGFVSFCLGCFHFFSFFCFLVFPGF